MNMKLSFLCGVTSSILVLSTSLSSAVLLNPNTVVPAVYEPDPAGALVQLDQISADYVAGDIQGTVISTVYSGDANNVWGGLTFTYKIISSQLSTEGVHRLTVGSTFGPFQTDVSYDGTTLPRVLPADIDRSFTGNVIGFNFDTPAVILPGQNSALLVIQTDAQASTTGIASVINNTTATVVTLVPLVPEPTTAALLGLGAFALISARRRR